ncbi:MAG: gamma-glutamylcyclotransferase [Actinomycetota bacterium]
MRRPTNLLFVYGTLKRGGALHTELTSQGVRFLGSAQIQGRLFRIPGESYPGALPTDTQEYVMGELYELENPRSALKRIDEIEGCDEGLFERKLVNAWVKNQRAKVWAYFYAKPLKKSSRISNGNFSTRSRTRLAR